MSRAYMLTQTRSELRVVFDVTLRRWDTGELIDELQVIGVFPDHSPLWSGMSFGFTVPEDVTEVAAILSFDDLIVFTESIRIGHLRLGPDRHVHVSAPVTLTEQQRQRILANTNEAAE